MHVLLCVCMFEMRHVCVVCVLCMCVHIIFVRAPLVNGTPRDVCLGLWTHGHYLNNSFKTIGLSKVGGDDEGPGGRGIMALVPWQVTDLFQRN